jgi:UDP-N-acetylglucosamine 2-epimerase (non-hydrolysing)
MKIISVVGARPQFVKLAPIAAAATEAGIEHKILHTGQHYDEGMSQTFFRDLVIPEPDINLAIGSGPHGVQTGRMLAALEPLLAERAPNWVLVYGDTNSTLAAAVAAVKLHLPLAHLEAGLRSHNRRMPEEHNRVLTDHAADLLLAPTRKAMENLTTEGLAARTVWVGDVMADICYGVRNSLPDRRPHAVLERVGYGDYALATLHRADNTDNPDRLAKVITALQQLPIPVLITAHPRLRDRAARTGIRLDAGSVHLTDPLGYPEMMAALRDARAVVTDSGGLQKEAYLLGTCCTTVRTETEWVETLDNDWNVLVPDPAEDFAAIVLRTRPAAAQGDHFGDGHAAEAVISALASGDTTSASMLRPPGTASDQGCQR